MKGSILLVVVSIVGVCHSFNNAGNLRVQTGPINKRMGALQMVIGTAAMQRRPVLHHTITTLNDNFTLSLTLRQAVYSSALGVPAALVEERDACGVGFVASLRYIALSIC